MMQPAVTFFRSLLLLTFLLPIALSSTLQASQRAQALESVQVDFRKIVQDAKSQVFPAVVYIKCVREDNQEGEKKSQEVSGSGVLISSEGEVLTNWHVIDKAQSVRCLLSDGQHFDASVVGSDKDTDLALLRLKLQPQSLSLPYAALGSSANLQEGDFVMAMGAPWGLNRSVSIGIVSCVSRYLESISEYSLWIQTDAAINPGNSGGPLVNTRGEIIGINARGMSWGAEGMGFAIPVDTVKLLISQMRADGKVNWSWTGLQLQPLRDFNKDIYFDGDKGVIVAETDPESPARRAGIEPRDRILAVNDTPITALTEEDLPAVNRILGLLAKGQPAKLAIQRADQTLDVEITPREKGKVEGEELALKRWDLTFKAINQFDNPELYFHRKEGIFVFATRYPGNASNAGLRSNDIVLKIDGQAVASLDQAKEIHKTLIAQVDSKPRIVFTVLRSGLMRQIVLDATRDHERE